MDSTRRRLADAAVAGAVCTGRSWAEVSRMLMKFACIGGCLSYRRIRANWQTVESEGKFFSDECPAMCPGVRADAVGVDAVNGLSNGIPSMVRQDSTTN